MAPKELVKGYSIQLECFLRSTVSINTENLRHKDRGNLRSLLFTKVHERYKFPADFANTRLSRNKSEQCHPHKDEHGPVYLEKRGEEND